MTTLNSLGRERNRRDAPSQLREATVLDPPLTADGWLRVEVDAQEGVAKECPWMPRLDLDPLPGDAAVVMESDDGNTWCVQWWSQSGEAPQPISGGGATWLSGHGAPDAALGDDGDFYLDQDAHAYYGPKAAGAWGAPVQLIGPQGPAGVQGPEGPQGVAGPQGPAGQSFAWRGAWAAGTAYHLDDAVMGSDGSAYIALGNTTGNDPTTDGGVHWSLSVIHGAVGPQGAQGPQGVQGPQGATGYDTSPIGSVITHTSQVIPDGYLLANGQQVNSIDYPQLDAFAQTEVAAGNPNWARPVVGGVQMITLPDLRDRFIYGAGAKAFGSKAGEENHLLLAAESGVNANGLTNNTGGHYHGARNGGQGLVQGGSGTANITMGGGSYTHDGSAQQTNVAGAHAHALIGRNADAAHNNMPPYCVLAFLVKAKGVTANAGVLQGPPGPPGVIQQIMDEGVALAARPNVDFRGSGVTATDDAVNGKTIVTVPGILPIAKVSMAGDYSAPAGDTVINVFSQMVFDNDGMWSAAQPDRLTVKTAGYYRAFYTFRIDSWSNSTGNQVEAWAVTAAGVATQIGAFFDMCPGAGWSPTFVVEPYYFNVGDYLRFNAYASPSPFTIHRAGFYGGHMTMERVF